VKKGQLLLRVQSADMAGAYSDYQKAQAGNGAARPARSRNAPSSLQPRRDLLERPADCAGYRKPRRRWTWRPLRRSSACSAPPAWINPRASWRFTAPVAGVITDQQVTNAGGCRPQFTQSIHHFGPELRLDSLRRIRERSFERASRRKADIRLNAYPNQAFTGVIGNVGPVLDPNLRTGESSHRACATRG